MVLRTEGEPSNVVGISNGNWLNIKKQNQYTDLKKPKLKTYAIDLLELSLKQETISEELYGLIYCKINQSQIISRLQIIIKMLIRSAHFNEYLPMNIFWKTLDKEEINDFIDTL